MVVGGAIGDWGGVVAGGGATARRLADGRCVYFLQVCVELRAWARTCLQSRRGCRWVYQLPLDGDFVGGDPAGVAPCRAYADGEYRAGYGCNGPDMAVGE